MKLLIFGATGKTGTQLLEQGLAQGHHITAFVRDPAKIHIHHTNLSVVKGDIDNYQNIKDAVAGQDAVISVLGNKTGDALWKSNTVISQALLKIISAMEEQKVSRIIFVTSFGVGSNIQFLEKLFIKIFLWNLFADIPRQESSLQKSGLQWTIVRPARLVDGPKAPRYWFREDLPIAPFSKISRADVADLIFKCLADPKTIKKILTVAS